MLPLLRLSHFSLHDSPEVLRACFLGRGRALAFLRDSPNVRVLATSVEGEPLSFHVLASSVEGDPYLLGCFPRVRVLASSIEGEPLSLCVLGSLVEGEPLFFP